MHTEYNYQHIQMVCPECKHTNIIVDNFHQETYCTHCGLVLHDTTIFKITQAIKEDNTKNKFIRDLWRKKRQRRQI